MRARLARLLVVLVAVAATFSAATFVERFEAHADCLPFRGVAGGAVTTYAIRSDGTLWHYGAGSAEGQPVPAVPDGLDHVTKVSADRHTLALRDGVVWSWGDNSDGQLGDGGTQGFARPIPLPVTGAPASLDVAAGSYHSLALSRTGTVWSWGWGYLGRLGDGTQTSHRTPIEVPGLTGIKAVAAGYYHSLALKSDGTVVAWGDNQFGQLGDGTHNNYRTSPTPVLRVTGAVAIAANQTESLALKADGTVWRWGSEPQNVAPTGPVQVAGLSGIVAIASEPVALHWVVLKSDGTVWTWGSNYEGQIGDGTTNYRAAPAKVNGLPHIRAVASGNSHSIALDDNGQIWSWGRNTSGELGDGTVTERHSPVRAQNVVQCFVPDTTATLSPGPVPTVSAAPSVTPTPTVPSGVGDETPVADCQFVRAEGEIVFGGYAITSGPSVPDLTTVKCTVATASAYYESTATLPGAVAATSAAKPVAPEPITICTYAEAVYADHVASTSHCRAS
jgi:alpha-tubulin suppressor-like RCC1 family protein